MVFRRTARGGKRVNRRKNTRRGKKNVKRTRNARKGGNVRRMRKTLRRRNRPVQKGGNKDLSSAVKDGSLETVNELIAEGADVNQVNTNGVTPLWIASDIGHVEVAKALLGAGADVNKAKTRTGSTPLYLASQNGHVEVVEALIKAGANVNQETTNDGTPPLWIASQNGHLEVVKALIHAGANVNQATTDDVTPLMISTAMIIGPERKEKNLDVIYELVLGGADTGDFLRDINPFIHTTLGKKISDTVNKALEIRDPIGNRVPQLALFGKAYDESSGNYDKPV